MKRKLFLLLVAAFAMLAFGPAQTRTALAAGSASATLSCAGIEVTGNSDFSPLTVIASAGSQTLGFKQYGFSGSASFDVFLPFTTTVAQGTSIHVRVTDGSSVLIDKTVACVGGILAGPSIPTGFVQRTITCTVAVRDLPGGNEVSGAVIWAGQRWYVSKTPTADLSGRKWTAIFVAGYNIPYIPTSCVAAF